MDVGQRADDKSNYQPSPDVPPNKDITNDIPAELENLIINELFDSDSRPRPSIDISADDIQSVAKKKLKILTQFVVDLTHHLTDFHEIVGELLEITTPPTHSFKNLEEIQKYIDSKEDQIFFRILSKLKVHDIVILARKMQALKEDLALPKTTSKIFLKLHAMTHLAALHRELQRSPKK